MAIPAEWTDPDTLELDPTDYYTSAIHNSMLGMLAFLSTAPQVALRLDSSQSVADNTNHTITWPDTGTTWTSPGDTMWDDAAPSKVIITRDGTYDLSAHAVYSEDIPWDDVTIACYKNGALFLGPHKGTQLNIQSTNLADLDELEIVVKQQFGSSVNLLDTQTRFTVRWVGFPPTGSPP